MLFRLGERRDSQDADLHYNAINYTKNSYKKFRQVGKYAGRVITVPWITSAVIDSQPTSESSIQPVDENIEPITKPNWKQVGSN